MRKIFITGVAGFIGFSLANNFLKKQYKVIGIDNFDNYYSVKLKKERLKILKKNKNFLFNNVDMNGTGVAESMIYNDLFGKIGM